MIRPAPITAYVGINGSGKTLSAVAVAITELHRFERPIVANVGGLAVEHTHYDQVEELPDILDSMGTCNLIMDEAGVLFAARDTGRNKAFEKTVQMLRKYDARLMWTAPAFGRADKILREVSLLAVLCHPLYQRHEPGKVWPSTRLALQKGFDVSRLDSSGMSINKNAKAQKRFGIIRTAKWEQAFNSFAVAGRPQLVEEANVA